MIIPQIADGSWTGGGVLDRGKGSDMVTFVNDAVGMCEKIPKNLTASSDLTLLPTGHLPAAPGGRAGCSLLMAGFPCTLGVGCTHVTPQAMGTRYTEPEAEGQH